MFEFPATDAQRALQREARAFAHDVLSGVPAAIAGLAEPAARFAATRPIYEQAIRAGFLRRLIPQPFGGGGSGLVDMAIVAEEFYAVDASVSLTLFANLLGLLPLLTAGTPEQQARLLPPFLATTGAPLAALANSEPGGSANFASPAAGTGTRTTARRDGADWVIDGEKQWISSATGWDGRGADLLCVVARSSGDGLGVFAVRRPAQGLSLVRAFDTLGHRGHLVPRFRLDGVRVADADVIGPVDGGRRIVDDSFTATAALVGIMGVGLLRAAFDFALGFARRERRGGALPILEHQAVGHALADAKTALEAARQLARRACAAMDAQAPGGPELALHSKLFGSETAVRVITDLMRVVGIDSYSHELPLAGLLQDALVLPLFDGGNLGVRRRQLHDLLRQDDYDALAAAG